MAIILTRPQPNIVMPDGAWMGRSANGPKVEFDDTNNYLEITGCNVGIGTTGPSHLLDVQATTNVAGLRVRTDNYTGTGGLFFDGGAASTGHISAGAEQVGADWIARDTSAAIMTVGEGNLISLYGNTGLTSGVAFSPAARVTIQNSGNLGIGTTGPSNLIHGVTNPATTNTIVDVLRLDRATSGTAADGIGCGVVLYAEDASANIEEAANIDAVFTTAAHATQVAEMRLGVMGTDIVAIDSKKNVVLAPAAIATDATDGFTYIPTCAGVPTGVPTAKTGTVALIFDTSNNKLYVYDGGWLNVTLAA